MTDSRRKGATGEREFAAAVLETLGVRLVRRLAQTRDGGHDLEPESDDDGLAARWLRRHAVEVKRYRAVTPASIATWWAQTVRQADAAGLAPLLAYRADRAPWNVVIALEVLVPTAPRSDGLPHSVVLSLDAFAVVARTTLRF